MSLRNLTIICISAVISFLCYQKAQYGRYVYVLADAMEQVSTSYIEPVDRRELFTGAMEGIVSRLDQYSDYIDEDDLTKLQEDLDQEFGGVGIVVAADPATNRLMVLSPLVGTPAYDAGMRAGDMILEIDGENTEGFDLNDAVNRMRGRPGTQVRLSVLHRGDQTPEQLTVTRAIIPIESILGDRRREDGSWDYLLESHPRIAYIRLTTFGEHTSEELTEALTKIGRDAEGIIVDVRDNAGGLLPSAVEVCDLFVDEGQIVSTRGRDGNVERSFSARPGNLAVDKSIPIAILVNQYTASASEILAACLQDHGRAKVVGQRTWGKGTVQNVIALEGGRSAIKLTTASYWRPSLKNIHRGTQATEKDDWGVRPDKDCEVILTDEQYQKLHELRRDRDIVRAADASAAPESTRPGNSGQDNGRNEGEESVERFEDIQLQRAIEYIESQNKS